MWSRPQGIIVNFIRCDDGIAVMQKKMSFIDAYIEAFMGDMS